MSKITITLTPDQANYMRTLLAKDIRGLQDTEVTSDNQDGIAKCRAFNHRITAKIMKPLRDNQLNS